MTNREAEQQITPEQIQQPDFVEGLVRTFRIPHILTVTEEENLCFIPPEGTQVDDIEEGIPGIGFTYYSHTGELRGEAELVVLDRTLSESVANRTRKTLLELGLVEPERSLLQSIVDWVETLK